MLSFTSYTKIGLRMATILGFLVSFASFIIAGVYLVLKLVNWETFPIGNAPILIGVYFLGGIQIFFIGLVGEYIMRIMKRPLVVEECRLNFEGQVPKRELAKAAVEAEAATAEEKEEKIEQTV